MSELQHRRAIGPMLRYSHWAIFGVLANTGIRRDEALSLEIKDVNLKSGILTVRESKFVKARLVPLHRSTMKVLRHFASKRIHYLGGKDSKYFFCSGRGTKCNAGDFAKRVYLALDRAGVRRLGEKGARLHDLRHSFAINTIENWYKTGKDVSQLLPRLSTYLGHKNISDTYWYLRFTAHLGGEAVKLLEASRKKKVA